MRILIVDDNTNKITELSKVIFEEIPKANILTSENIVNAVKILTEEDVFNIIFIDLFLPLKQNEKPLQDGGKKLLDEIYRKKGKLNLPNFIFGFSQYYDNENEFSNIWKVIYYKSNSDEWKSSIKNILVHVKHSNFDTKESDIELPKVFVEGLTDKSYLETACDIFYKDYKSKFQIVSQENAGANWVGSQMSISAIKLSKDPEGKYIKSIGLLDSDEAGNIAKNYFETKIKSDNEKKCASVLQLKPSYNPDIVEFYKNKCKIEIEIETLFPIEVFKHAEKENWLEYRTQTFTEAPNDWEQHKETSLAYIDKKLGNQDMSLYVKKVRIAKKITFRKYISELDNKEYFFKNFKPLLKDIITKLNI